MLNNDMDFKLQDIKQLMNSGLYEEAEDELSKVVEQYPYDYRGWWEYAKFEYVYKKRWFDDSKFYKVAVSLCEDDSVVTFRNKEYEIMEERMREEIKEEKANKAKKIIEFCNNPKHEKMDGHYVVLNSSRYSNNLKISGDTVGFEEVLGEMHLKKYLWNEEYGYSKCDLGKISLSAEIDESTSTFVGFVLNEQKEYIIHGKERIYISDINENGVVLCNRENKNIIDLKLKDRMESGCYIATCVYGSYDCPQVWILRRFRDYTLEKKWYGRLFIKSYYVISPIIVKWFGDTYCFKRFWRKRLDKIVNKLKQQGVEDTQYMDKY